MSKMQKNLKDQKKVTKSPFNDYWHKINYTFLILSMLVLITGYYFMTIGTWNSTLSMSVSPVILLIVYLILIPLAIFLKPSSKQKEE
jgi:membrane-anchored glycerophosphoryl diester phosphodiesterase (GDPDase)